MENIVIGIEGTVGAGKTSICRELLKDIENSIILHGGEIYRAIVYGMMQKQIENAQNLDAFDIMKKLGIEIKLENKETVIYMNGKKVDEKDLQSKKSSMAVSKVSNTADNTRLYQFGKELIDKYREKYNVILVGITKEGQWFSYTGPVLTGFFITLNEQIFFIGIFFFCTFPVFRQNTDKHKFCPVKNANVERMRPKSSAYDNFFFSK